MNMIIDVFIGVAISVFLSVLLIALTRILIGKYKNVENIRVGAMLFMLIFSCALNGFLICWLLINYQYLPKPF